MNELIKRGDVYKLFDDTGVVRLHVADIDTIPIVDVVDKIATFLEDAEHWCALRCCWLENGRSDDLRKLLTAAMK